MYLYMCQSRRDENVDRGKWRKIDREREREKRVAHSRPAVYPRRDAYQLPFTGGISPNIEHKSQVEINK